MMLSSELTTFLTAMTPVGELRAALPLGIISFKMNVALAYLLSVLGNMVPVFLLLLFWRYAVQFLRKNFKIFDNFFNWLFERTRKKFEGNYVKWGKLALVLFVAIPLPVTGAWTGTVAAWLFGFKYWESVGLIFIGVLIAGAVVSLITLGGVGIFNFI